MTNFSPQQPPQNEYAAQPQHGYATPFAQGTPGTADPRPHVGLGQALKNNFKYLFHFSGRASRSEFWWAWGFWSAIFLVVLVATLIILISVSPVAPLQENFATYTDYYQARKEFDQQTTIIAMIFSLVLFGGALVVALLTASVSWRRLHDAGFSGAFWLLSFVGLSIVPFIMYFFPSSPVGLKYDNPEDKNRP